jgi:hypothetical protein
LLKILPDFQRSPAGLEWAVLRRLPIVSLVATVLPVAVAIGACFFMGDAPSDAKRITTIYIMTASVLVLHWTILFTVALFCVIVLIAKGPAYVADAYPLVDSDRPAP